MEDPTGTPEKLDSILSKYRMHLERGEFDEADNVRRWYWTLDPSFEGIDEEVFTTIAKQGEE